MQSKAQVTVFVILGVILLFSTALIISSARTAYEKQLQNQASTTLGEFIQSRSINRYVESCIQRVASEGLLLLGNQGGVIYTDQGGLTNRDELELGEDYFEYSYYEISTNGDVNLKTFNVSYGIRDDVDCPNFYSPEIIGNFDVESQSFYPADRTYLSELHSRFNSYPFSMRKGCASLLPSVDSSGYLGENNLVKLCDREGINVQLAGEIFTCMPSAYSTNAKPDSIQEQLSVYIKNNLNSCFNFSIYEEMGASIRETGDEINVSAVFTNPDGLLVYAKYPFFVDVGGRSILTVAQFSGELDVNIKTLYYYLQDLITHHLKNPLFNVFEDWKADSNIFYRPSFFVQHIRSPCASTGCTPPYDDIIKIGDLASLVDGKPLTFSFAIKQRKPILEYMHQRGLTTVFNGKLIDYQYRVGDLITLEPLAVDPDNDSMRFNYSGWKETYDEVFDADCCFTKGVKQVGDGWGPCGALSEPGCAQCTLESYGACVETLTDAPYDWTGHPLFTPENGTSQIQTSESDAGYREVILSVKDEHGAMDYQIIRFLIFDYPEAVLESRNLYEDVNDSWASIEDVYILDGSSSTASVLAGGDLSHFLYSDLTEIEQFDVLKTTSCAGLAGYCVEATGSDLMFLSLPNITGTEPSPSNTPWLDILTNTYRTKWFDSQNNDFNGVKFIEHTIQLIVQQVIGGDLLASLPDEKLVNVAQCLPHNYNDAFEAYPYNGVVDFKNVCCAPIEIGGSDKDSKEHYFGGTFEDEDTQCYETTSTMCYPFDINENPIEFYPLNLALTETSDDGNVSNREIVESEFGSFNELRMNDIFTLNYEQNCSGNRGNICSGDVGFSLTQSKTCNDYSTDSQFARCQGPLVTDFSKCQNNMVVPTDCKNYDEGDSFEKIIGWYPEGKRELVEAGFCDDLQTSKIRTISPFIVKDNGGVFNCNARCNGAGGCTYHELDQCSCNKDNICKITTANQYYDSNYILTKFVCKGDVACKSDCNALEDYTNDKYACYCKQSGSLSNPAINLVEPFYNKFFNSVMASEPGPTKCCLTGTYIYDGTQICNNGYIEESILSRIMKNTKVLFVQSSTAFLYCKSDGESNPAGWTSSNIRTTVSEPIMISTTKYTCTNTGWSKSLITL